MFENLAAITLHSIQWLGSMTSLSLFLSNHSIQNLDNHTITKYKEGKKDQDNIPQTFNSVSALKAT